MAHTPPATRTSDAFHGTQGPESKLATQNAGGHDGHAGHHHGHHIVPQRVLLTVFGLLLFFTFATVGAAQFEQWISIQFDVVIPQWVNVAVALSIAVVKSVIVAAFFMQLKYDSPVNSLVVVFTLMCFACFIGFTSIDLGNRDALYDYKARHITKGGTGGILVAAGEDADGKTKYEQTTKPQTVRAKELADAEIASVLSDAMKNGRELTPELLSKNLRTRYAIRTTEMIEKNEKIEGAWGAFLAKNPSILELAHSGHGGHGGGHSGHAKSSAAMSRPMTGLKAPLVAGHGHGKGDSHTEHAPDASKGEHGATKPAAVPAAGGAH